MNDELFNTVREDMKISNTERKVDFSDRTKEEKRLIEAKLAKLFPGHDLEVKERDDAQSLPLCYFKWHQPDLGINLAVARIIYNNRESNIELVGEANGASRSIKIERPADVYSCKGFPSIYEYEKAQEDED